MKCINDSSKYYKGNESSPKGLGYCAFGEEIGKKMLGLDKMIWEVKLNSAGNKIWSKIGYRKLINYDEGSKERKIINIIDRLKEEFDSASYDYYEDYYGHNLSKDKDFDDNINKLREELNIPEYEKF